MGSFAEPEAKPEARARRVALSSFTGHESPALEQEADLAAQHVLDPEAASSVLLPGHASASSPGVQPKCACAGACNCQEGIQRWPDVVSGAASLIATGVDVVRAAISPTIVEDDADAGPDQIRKSAFLAGARAALTTAADEELSAIGRSTSNCPYIDYWWGKFRGYNAQRMERAVILFAQPGTRSPSGYMSAMASAARQRVLQWISSGSAAVPDDVDALTSIGADGDQSAAQAKSESGDQTGPASVPDSILSRLGAGAPLGASERSRMEHGFGDSLRDVRIHTGTTASRIAREHNALALTVGSNILFRDGQYRPGTMHGDVLLAHELAHTIQQRGGGVLSSGHEGAEADADHAALGAVGAMHGYGAGATINRRTGVGVQACNPTVKRCPPGMTWGNVAHGTGTVGAGSFGCACTYRCVPETYTPRETSICPATGCRRITYETVGENYEFRVDGEVQRVPVATRAGEDETAHGWGASSTPLTGEHTCLCGGVDIEGDATGRREAVSMVPIAVDATDVVGPVVEGVAARRGGGGGTTDTRTGVRQPPVDEAPPVRRTDPMTPPPEHVGSPPVRDRPGGASDRPTVGEFFDSPFPHVQQREANWCGAACGEMAARRLGIEIDQAALARTPHFEPRSEVGHTVFEGGFQTGPLGRALTEVAPIPGRRWVAGPLHQDISTPAGLRTHLQGYLDATGASIILRVRGTEHWIIVDSILPDGRFAVRDPAQQRSTALTADELHGMSPNGDVVLSFPERPR